MKKIGYKLWLGMVILVFCVMAGIWIFQLYFYPKSYISKKQTETIEKSYALASELLYNQEQAILTVQDYEKNNIKVVILDSENNITYTSGVSYRISEICIGIAPFLSVAQIYTDELKPPNYDARYFMVGIPIGEKDNMHGVLYLFLPFADLEATTEIIKSQFILITGFFLLGSILVAAIISVILTKSISKIEKRAEAMAAGDLTTPFVSTTKDEIGRLTDTMENLRKALLQFDLLSKELIANVSHELRTPLAIIRGFAETVRDVTWKDEVKREAHLEAIIQESQRLERVVNDILDYSQLQAGEIKFEKAKINLSNLVLEISNRLGEYTKSKNINIETNIVPDQYVMGDKTKLEQVLTNLIANAFNHSPEYSKINISLYNNISNNNLVFLEVQDQGEGIPEEELDFIWKRYYTTTLKARKDKIGSGLGLAICKIILDAHDVNIFVVSKVNIGSTFKLEFKNIN